MFSCHAHRLPEQVMVLGHRHMQLLLMLGQHMLFRKLWVWGEFRSEQVFSLPCAFPLWRWGVQSPFLSGHYFSPLSEHLWELSWGISLSWPPSVSPPCYLLKKGKLICPELIQTNKSRAANRTV